MQNYILYICDHNPFDFLGGLNKHRQEILERVEKNKSIAQKKQKAAYDQKHANPCKFLICASMHTNQFHMFYYVYSTGGHGGASQGFQEV